MAAIEQVPAPPTGAPGKKGGGRAGRNLPAAIAVGVSLGAAVLLTLFLFKPAFVALVILAIGGGTWEFVRALETRGLRAPLVPLLTGGTITLALAYVDGVEASTVALLLTALAVYLWRLAEGPVGFVRDASTAVMIAVYLPFLAGFALMLAAASDGSDRVIAFIATTVCSDVGGYTVGVLAGKHLMAPTVSPKKSWEGFAGSTLACVGAGIGFFVASFDGHWWQGVIFGLAVVIAATVGDLGESMIKRDLEIKDMGTLLPGHGGLMERLDSLLPAAPVAWLVLSSFVPPH